MRKTLVLTLAITALTTLAACSSIQLPGVYRLVIQQGNIVTQDMVDQLEPGMTKRQVNFVLGTPLVMDTFNSDRWDYMYTVRDSNGDRSQRHMTVYFENDKLSHFKGDYRPSSSGESDTTIPTPPLPTSETVTPAPSPTTPLPDGAATPHSA